MKDRGKTPGGAEEFILGWRVSRRRLIALGGAGGALLTMPPALRDLVLPESDGLWEMLLGPEAAEATAPTFTAILLRPDDQLRLIFEFVNLQHNAGMLEPTGSPSLMRVLFGSQHTVEHASAVGVTPPGGAQESLGARPTRVVFEIGAAVPFTTSSLLDFGAYALHIDGRANPAVGGGTTDPDEDVTAIEAPAGLVLSPGPSGRFVAGQAPVTHSDVTEVWRARLGTLSGAEVVDSGEVPAEVRAIFNSMPVDHFTTSTTFGQRDNLVEAMSKYDSVNYTGHEATEARRLHLTPAGAELDLSGDWAGTGTVEAWLHRASTGRDIVVRITERGRLAPFGHKASTVTVTERKFVLDAAGEVEAKLVQTSFLAIKTPGRVEYPNLYMPNSGRGMPFTEITAIDPGQVPVGKRAVRYTDGAGTIQEADLAQAWRVVDEGTLAPLPIDFNAIDRLGNEVSFSAEVVFIAEEHAFDMTVGSAAGKVRGYYADNESLSIRELDFSNQPVGFADETEPGNARTQKVTDKIRFTLELPGNGANTTNLIAADWPAFFPKMEFAWIRDDAVDALSAGRTPPDPAVVGGPTTLQTFYAASWLTNGTGAANTGMRYLDLVTPVDASVGGSTRSMVQPDLEVSTFSLAYGAGAPPAATWNPETAMDPEAKILGIFKITDIVGPLDAFGAGPLGAGDDANPGVPKFEVELIPGEEPLDLPIGTLFRFTWTPPLKSIKVGGDYLFVIADDLDLADLPQIVEAPTEAQIVIEQSVFFDGRPSESDLDVLIRRFAIQLPPSVPALALIFESLRYLVPPDGNDDLKIDLAGVRFLGTLNFLDPFQDFLEALGVEAGVELRGSTVYAFLSIPVPALEMGIVSIDGFDVRFDLVLPLSGGDPPETTMSVGTQDDPVGIAVMGIGGGAYFLFTVDPEGIVRLQLEIFFMMEAEAKVMGTGVSAGISVGMGLELTAAKEVLLSAFVRLWGTVTLLGFPIVDVNAEARLTYNLTTKVLRGTLELVVDWGIFGETNGSVEAEVELGKKSGGAPRLGAAGGSTTAFPDRFSEDQWKDYCNAFSA